MGARLHENDILGVAMLRHVIYGYGIDINGLHWISLAYVSPDYRYTIYHNVGGMLIHRPFNGLKVSYVYRAMVQPYKIYLIIPAGRFHGSPDHPGRSKY